MKLLSVITSLNPAHGGPVECAIQLQHNLTKAGHIFDVVTLDSPDAAWNRNLAFKPICLGKKNHGSSQIQLALIDFLRTSQKEYDGSVFHGIWTFPNVAIRACWNGQHRYVVFPHGMLDPYFIKTFPFKNIKKSLYYRFIAASVLKRAHAVLFTCEEERRLAEGSYSPVVGNRKVVRYGINPPKFDIASYDGQYREFETEWADKEVCIFIGRIHPKKGCDLLVEAIARLAPKYNRLRLVIAGPDDSHWTKSLQRQAQRSGVGDRITWLGPVYGADKWYLYNIAKVFILPSHMENFGMVVAESLSQGLPVLLSDKVNIYPSIIRAEAGFVAPDTVEGTVHLLQRWLDTPEEKRILMKRNCTRLFNEEFQAIHTSVDLLSIFNGKAPDPMQELAAVGNRKWV